WAGINPVSALRSRRNGSLMRLVGFFSCVAASALTIAKDAIMSGQELDDVNLCRESVYLRQPVTPLDSVQLPGIKVGLLLWDLSSGFHLLALGCLLASWASSLPVRQTLGCKDGIMNGTRRKLMLAWGAVGLAVAIGAHFGAQQGDDAARARSISRIVTSALFFVTLALLIWVILCVGRIVRRQMNRPLITIHQVQNVQVLAFTNESAQLLALVLFVRSLFLLAFDISYLSPAQALVKTVGSSSALLGIGTLASSLVSACIVNVLFPRRLGVLCHALAKVSLSGGDGGGEKEQVARMAFFDDNHTLSSPSHLEQSLAPSGGGATTANLNGGGSSRKSRSRAPTTASLAVEKFMPSRGGGGGDRLDQS
ncbi:hypothetical protein GGI21_006270, partial [Coemansia aciculifera]